ncbi:TRAP-type C4-dicarboxylate transport system,large permease component [Halanaerobium saccharolyticum subsp. saccharolyticum DSM 6643]|uniref:TRAP-type C4-dicarboxylate transport system,large permease component n=1 Tax=Halanaerobium saccharolyticum subsp. saccharolyticum DSM 6643 TaxID=1293054 RepID=M5EHN5_9FIRM|nr:TRAP transporter large permease [Halanaerobium saccharolyticum]CCU81003.1 TRAP-type C4-dicarboxylate transport system,large permease component [Halanaerobium saccharolyticum subsp. saccharolyticum DSM 6643]
MAVTALILSLFIFILLGLPISFSLGLSSMAYFILNPDFLIMMPQRIWAGANSSVMVALPLFCMAGMLMNLSGITRKIIDFCSYLVKPFKGGLGEVNVIASMIFGGISGSSVSDTSALGSVLIPEMENRGYSKAFATGVTVGSSTVGMIIPPSIPMIIYSTISNESVGALFLAGLIPGLLIGTTQLFLVHIISRRNNYPIEEGKFEIKEMLKRSVDGILSISMPVFIVLSVSLGVATATESAGVAVLYAVIIGFLVYKKLKLSQFAEVAKETLLTSSTIMVIIAFAYIFIWILAFERIPDNIGNFILSLNISYFWILVFLDILILLVGMFIDVSPALLLLGPILVPVMETLGMDLLQLGAILIVGLGIGLATPPIGMCLNAAAKLSDMSIMEIAKETLPFLACNVLVLILVTFFPQVSLWIPSMFF